MRIDVTAEDIRDGLVSCHLCPVALAVRRATGCRVKFGLELYGAGRLGVWRIEGPDGQRIVAPGSVAAFGCRFVSGSFDPVLRPFSFELPDDFLPRRDDDGC